MQVQCLHEVEFSMGIYKIFVNFYWCYQCLILYFLPGRGIKNIMDIIIKNRNKKAQILIKKEWYYQLGIVGHFNYNLSDKYFVTNWHPPSDYTDGIHVLTSDQGWLV